MGGWRGRLALGLKAGVVTGLVVTGIGGRVTMRLIALGQPRVPAFTVAGSLVVVAAGTAVGTGGGLLYALARPRLPGRGLARGLLFGLLVWLLGLAIGFPQPAVPPGGHWETGDVVARLGFLALSLVAGAALEATTRWLEARTDADAPAAGQPEAPAG